MLKTVTYWLLVAVVLLDLGYSYLQYYQMPLDGDLAVIALPSELCRQVLQDPFGWAAFSRHEVYIAPNRFFAHLAMHLYFRHVPLWLQQVTDPISSVYAACALFKTAVQALLFYLLGVYIGGTYRLSSYCLWLGAALVAPLFQASGYQMQMGIIDHSVSYVFFYAFPLALLLLFFLPFYQAAYFGQPLRLSWLAMLAFMGLAVVLAFNGPIVVAAASVLFLGIGVHWVGQQWRATRQPWLASYWVSRLRTVPAKPVLLLGFFAVLCLYSLYLGRYEAESYTHTLPLFERYRLLPQGVYKQLTVKLGLPLLIALLLLNRYVLRRLLPFTPTTERITRGIQWLGLFALVYVLLLPLGGYRNYRPLILRRDSILPIILGMVYCYGISSWYVVHHLAGKTLRWYLAALGVCAAIYMAVDKPRIASTDNNDCERLALQQLAQSSEPVVKLGTSCTVMAFEQLTEPSQSESNAQLLAHWRITKGKKLYYQAPAGSSLIIAYIQSTAKASTMPATVAATLRTFRL
ncbi:hypothetical protein [Hymenobacter sp. AT01-02]|uniref:hypothetical protein n=1 Tax=Hymenobacter sp. AT01-02 TaxID=1571877 RepID=UPI0006E3595E|nr:hypothetical protein [Hymenobacter sp. AT01-02]